MKNHSETQNINDPQAITLRCSKCGKPITPQEAIQTPTGYRCAACVKKQQKIFDTSRPLDSIWGFLIALVLSFLGSLLVSAIGFFTVLLAPAAGAVVAEAVRAVTGKRRSKRLFRLVTLGMILGGLNGGAFNLFSLLPLGYRILYLVLAVPSAHYRLSGSRRL